VLKTQICVNRPQCVNILGESARAMNRNTRPSLVASKEIGLEANAQKAMRMFVPHEQNASQYHHIKLANKSFETEGQFKYLGQS